MQEPIEEAYFNWLCAKVVDARDPNYRDLMRILHTTEFAWIVHGDHNRAQEGMELRENFLREAFLRNDDPGWYEAPCSVLEMLIAFADRASFQTDTPLREWFWHFLRNLRFDEYRRVSGSDRREIGEILETFIFRIYDPNGEGGMFPLRSTDNDQRKVEIWYQFCEYLDEQGLI